MGRERAAAAAPQETLGWRIGLKWESDLQSRDERLRRPGTPYRCLRPFQPASERPRTSAASGLESACTPPPRACVGKVLSGRVPVPAYRTFLYSETALKRKYGHRGLTLQRRAGNKEKGRLNFKRSDSRFGRGCWRCTERSAAWEQQGQAQGRGRPWLCKRIVAQEERSASATFRLILAASALDLNPLPVL